MPRDPLVEAAGLRLEAIYSKAQKLVLEWFGRGDGIQKDPVGYRISIIAVMKMLCDLTILEAEKRRSKT